jgi:ligand-binding sensor domain-containing protein/signal transduction histidine kinase
MNRAAALALLFAVLTPESPGQAPEFQVETLTVKDGLSQSSVWTILQDKEGFMWFGTADGLNRFDGYTFKVYRHDAQDPFSLRSNTVLSLLEDRQGIIWVGSSHGLDKYDRRTGRFSYLADDSMYRSSHLTEIINSLVEDHDGNIWIGRLSGLSILRAGSRAIQEYGASAFGPIGQDQIVRVHFVDSTGDVWASCSGRVYRYARSSCRFVELPIPEAMVSGWLSLYQAHDGQIWLGSAGNPPSGLSVFDKSAGSWRRLQHDPRDSVSLSGDLVRAFCEDANGRLWVGTTSGGLHVLSKDERRFTRVAPDPDNTNNAFYDKVASIYCDRSGLIWVGYDGSGIVKVNPHPPKFHHVLLPVTKNSRTGPNFFKALIVDRNDRVWLGTYNQGIAILSRGTGAVERLIHNSSDPSSLASNGVFALLEGRDGTIWIGTLEGLDSYDSRSERLHHHQLPAIGSDETRGRIVWSLYEDSAGVVWVGTATHVLAYRGSEIESVLRLSGIDSLAPFVGALCFAQHQDGIWCGTSGAGLLQLSRDGRVLRRYMPSPTAVNSISHPTVKTICEDPDGILWVGTEDGLNRFDPSTETWRVYRTADGLPNDFIYGLLMDSHRNLWISTNRGLSKMNTVDSLRPRFRNYTVRDGLQSEEFNTNTYFNTPQGEMFFGGVNGFNSFFPDSVKDNPILPRVVLTGLKKFDVPAELDEEIAATREIHLTYEETVFSLEFAGLEYTYPKENRYAYRLDGVDKDWVYCGKRREARYTHLNPGRYLFHVRASNSDGVWNEEGISMAIVVVPPFWQTWWFIGIVALAGAGAFGGVVRFISTQKLKKRILELEHEKAIQEERMRTREQIARDLHDDLASTVGSAGMFVESVKHHLKDDPTQANEFLNKTSSLLNEAEQSMSDIVWSVSPQHDTLESLLVRIRLQTSDLCRASGLQYEVSTPEFDPAFALPGEIRRNIYLVFKEAINNAVQHACAQLVRVSISYLDGVFEVEVADNGKGVSTDQNVEKLSKRGHGLRNMKQRADEIGAELEIVSSPGKGTTIRLRKRIARMGH